jgi:hypothetical protein
MIHGYTTAPAKHRSTCKGKYAAEIVICAPSAKVLTRRQWQQQLLCGLLPHHSHCCALLSLAQCIQPLPLPNAPCKHDSK